MPDPSESKEYKVEEAINRLMFAASDLTKFKDEPELFAIMCKDHEAVVNSIMMLNFVMAAMAKAKEPIT